MFKPTPNPPGSEIESIPSDASIDSPKKTHDATDSDLEDYLKFSAFKNGTTPRKPSTMFMIVPDVDTETLLAHACESLASANVMACDLAGFLEGPHRNTLLAIAQIIMLGELAVNRALDNIDPQD